MIEHNYNIIIIIIVVVAGVVVVVVVVVIIIIIIILYVSDAFTEQPRTEEKQTSLTAAKDRAQLTATTCQWCMCLKTGDISCPLSFHLALSHTVCIARATLVFTTPTRLAK